MKNKFLFSVIFAAGLMFVNFSGNQVNGQEPQIKLVNPQAIKYTCPMHPEVVQDVPGNCPKCGMNLVEKKKISQGDLFEAKDSLKMNKMQKDMMPDSTPMKRDQMLKDTTSKRLRPL